MNYGHRLQAGALVTGVEAAQAAEALGYDLVAVGESPDGADPWTVLSWIAGSTGRIRLAGGAASPGHEPTVLGRAAAGLDLLSGGRLELVVRADEEVLAETVEIVRGMLDAGEPGPLRHRSGHFTVTGAQRGPLPAHRIPVWLSGDALRLAGRTADVWHFGTGPAASGLAASGLAGAGGDLARAGGDLAGLIGKLVAANQVIDEAAVGAGREAGEIRRAVTVSPGVPAADLVALVTEAGVGTLLLRTDDPAELRRFAEEILPIVGAAVPEPTAAVVRPAAVRAKRRAGIDYDAVPASLAETAVEPGDLDYARVRSTYMRGGAPGLVLRPRTTAEVADALAFVRAHPGVPFGLRSGGHGISGRSTNDGGIVVSLKALDGIEILDEGKRLIRVGPGARWMDIAQALLPFGWALSSGDYGGVGVGGLATAGGVGWLAREHGLTIDHLRAVEMVLADGTVVRASAEENADLFWAVRGAGGNFGVVTSFEFEVDEVGNVGFAQLAVAADDPADLLVRWGRAIEAAPRAVTGQFIMGGPRPGQPKFAQLTAVVDADDPETIVELLQPLAQLAPLYNQSVVLTPYAGVMANAADGYHSGQGDPTARSGLIEHLTPEFARAAAAMLESGAVHWFQIRAVGGAVADVPAEATAYAHRSANFSVVVMGSSKRRVDAAWEDLYSHFDGMYLSFETDQSPARLTDAFPPAHLTRLRELKRRYDPGNLFRDNFNIDPAGGM